MKRGLVGKVRDAKKLVNAYFHLVAANLGDKPEHVGHAANSGMLGGKTLAALVQAARDMVKVHADLKNNPHELTPAVLGAYSTSEFDALLPPYVKGGVLNITRFGTLDYLPVGVAGNFEGATTVKITGADDNVNDREAYSMCLENNGNLVFLRNGSNGSTQGVYYGYIPDAVNADWNRVRIINSGRKYSPAFVPSGSTVGYLYGGGQTVVAGRFQNAAGVLGQTFITPMNGTLNDAAHQQCVLLPASWDAKLDLTDIVQTKDYFYLLVHYYTNAFVATNKHEYELWRIPVTALGTGVETTPTRVTVGQCTGWLGKTFNTGNITLGDYIQGKAATDSAPIQHVGGDLSNGFFAGQWHIPSSGRPYSVAVPNADGTKLRFMVQWCPRFSAVGKGLQQQCLLFSFVLDLASMTAALDAGIQPMLCVKNAAGTIDYSGNSIDPNNALYVMWSTNANLHDQGTKVYYTETGIGFNSSIAYAPSSFDYVNKTVWGNMTSIYEQIKMPATNKDRPTVARKLLANYPTYGSPAGDSFDGFRLLPGMRAFYLTRNQDAGQGFVTSSLKLGGGDFTTNYAYKTVSRTDGLTIPGYAPTADRVNVGLLADPTLTNLLSGMVYEMTDAGALNAVRGTVFAQGTSNYNRWVSIDGNLATSGSCTIVEAVLESAKQQALTKLGWNGGSSIKECLVELVIPANVAVSPWILIHYTGYDQTFRFAALRVATNARSGVINTVTVNDICLQFVSNDAFLSTLNPISTDRIRQGTHYVYETDDAYLIVGNPQCLQGLNSGSVYRSYRFSVNKADGALLVGNQQQTGAALTTNRYAAWPGQGVGFFGPYDYNCKLVFIPYARTKAQFSAWTPLVTNTGYTVIASQEVAQGFVLYFTEETPIILNGWPGKVAVQSIDLKTVQANPANTTFYIYVERSGQVFTYTAYTSYQAPNATRLYLGTVVTGATQITTINVGKVTEFGGYRLNQTPFGMSIPVAPGIPSRVSGIDAAWWS